jgi:NADH:ubiquinone reductase (H+-translocating)
VGVVVESHESGGKSMSHVVVVGAGFAGLAAVKSLIKAKRPGTKITLIDQRNYHLFQPLLYQVATAGLSPADIAAPIRSIIPVGVDGADVLKEKVVDIDPVERLVRLEGGAKLRYDELVLACGASHSYFGHPEWEELAPGLKTLEHATEIRRRILDAFERAESTSDEALRRDLMTFVVVGGGPTGVELAGAIGEISRQTLAKDFSHIEPSSARIVLIELGKHILPSFSPELSRRAMRDLEKLGVTVWTSTRVTNITADGVQLGNEMVGSKTVLWAAGVKASPIGKKLGVPLDPQGRVEIDDTLRVIGVDHVFAVGDMARLVDKKYGVLPGLAPVAMQQGRWVARNVLRALDQQPLESYRYLDKGQMATIGRKKAVSEFRGLKMTGLIAWLAWLVVHIYYLVGFRSRLFVLLQWISSYVLFKRGARLITGGDWHSQQSE